jgi:hypothetical protein
VSEPDALGQVFGQVADVPSGFLGAAEDALDVHLRSEAHDVRGLGQLRAGLVPGGLADHRRYRLGVDGCVSLCARRSAREQDTGASSTRSSTGDNWHFYRIGVPRGNSR